MAFVYEINGQRVEFDKEPTDADIDEAARQLGAVPAVPEKSQARQEVEGIATALAVPAAQALQTVVENPIQSALGAYGAYKGASLANAGIDALKSMKAPPMAAPVPTAPVAPVAPVAPAVSPILDAQGRPMVRPVAPPAAPPARTPAPTGVLDKATQMVRQLAANRVVQGAAKFGGALVGGLTTPGNVGQNYPFPQSGPLSGSEINPGTGRAWTQQELDAYRAQYGG
jgi:hypothetical protein